MFDNKLFGNRIKQFRQKRKLTQEQLSEIADISFSYLTHIEAGNNKPTVEVILKLINALNITYSELLNDTDYNKILDKSLIENLKFLNNDEINFMSNVFSKLRTWKRKIWILITFQ